MLFTVGSSLYGRELFVQTSPNEPPTLVKDIDGTCGDSIISASLEQTDYLMVKDGMYFVVQKDELWFTGGTTNSTTKIQRTKIKFINFSFLKCYLLSNFPFSRTIVRISVSFIWILLCNT